MIVGIRHGRVWNPQGLVYARLPGFHLSEDGRAEVQDLVGALASVQVSAVYSSPLERAMETAGILAAPHGIPVREDERLLEWSFWVRWQGMAWDRIREIEPDVLRQYAEDPGHASPGDTLANAGGRVLSWAADAETANPSGLVIGVTHEAPLVAATLLGDGRGMERYHSVTLAHLASVRLLPGPPEVVDLVAWARSC